MSRYRGRVSTRRRQMGGVYSPPQGWGVVMLFALVVLSSLFK